ncbi:hypothetical protein XU18_5065 [Perkinsela sp. CCAP 1560/4]|nr:hypothetical protein XU18_5065 [Perkinsela sp. CCAP 1560/4]|eukprot:KNH02443.1 hypothetical protein XU18_5065 [Perkinsela sp. CCAP 1560/4]
MADPVRKRTSGEAVAHRHPADYELWTYGSYAVETSSVAGAVLIIKQGKGSQETVAVGGKGRSSFRSECLALHAGLARIIVASDSPSLLRALRGYVSCETTPP